MNTTITSAGALTPFASVALAVGLEAWALQKLEQARFRTEENYREVEGLPFLTVAGIRAMAATLKAHGYASKAHTLTVLANRTEQTPSARLITAMVPKSSDLTHPWQSRADLV